MITAITFDICKPLSAEHLTSSKVRRVIEFINDLNIVCTFFIVPGKYTSHASEEYISCLKYALSSGHELSLHGYTHAKNEFGIFFPVSRFIPFPTLQRQIERIEKGRERLLNLVGARPKGFRAPCYLHNSNTLKALASLDFKYDSSATIFKPTHCSHFRMRWLRDYRPFITNGILEFPVTGDYTYNLESYGFSGSLKIAMRDFKLVKSSGGIFVINNHCGLFSKREFQFLKTLIIKLHRKTTFCRLIDVAQSLLNNHEKIIH